MLFESAESSEVQAKPAGLRLPAVEFAKGRSRRTRNRSAATRLGSFIVKVFSGFSVTRRDREEMERLLSARYAMLYSDSSRMNRELLGKPYFSDALLLLRCTAHNDFARQRLAFWEEQYKEAGAPAKNRDRKKTKRKRSRRRNSKRNSS